MLFIVIIPISSFAQTEEVYHFDTLKTIKKDVYFNKVKVLDNRLDKSNIGYLRKDGVFKSKKIELKLVEPLDASLEKYIARSISGVKKNDKELLLVIYNFRAEDAPIGNECASLYIKMDAFSGAGGNYKFVASIDSFYEKVAGDATRMIRPFISEKMISLVEQLGAINPDTIQSNKIFSLEQAKGRISEYKKSKPIYITSQKDGLYRTYEQFLSNEPESTPVIVENIIVTESLTYHYAYQRKENGKKGERINEEDVFAVCYKGKWFISNGKKLEKMIFEDGDFYTYAEMLAAFNHMDYMAWFAPAFYIVGSKTGLSMPGQAKGTYKVRLDIDSGALLPVKRISRQL